MNFSEISDRNWLGKLIRLPLRLIPAQMVVRILQGRLRGKKWIAGSSVHGCWLGSYEYNKRHLFERLVQPGQVIFDIGANVGYYTLLASILTGVTGKVVAFEPLPQNVYYLKEHLRLNHVQNVDIIEGAVAEHGGQVSFAQGQSNSEGHIAEKGELHVKTYGLDELFEAGTVPHPDILKIDVEGGEVAVLLGAQRLLAQMHPTILLATHSPAWQAQCCDLLSAGGYVIRPINDTDMRTADEILAQ